jgi:hypothetical protein
MSVDFSDTAALIAQAQRERDAVPPGEWLAGGIMVQAVEEVATLYEWLATFPPDQREAKYAEWKERGRRDFEESPRPRQTGGS